MCSVEKIKPSERAEGKIGGMSGQKLGHACVSHHRRSKEAIHRRPGKCDRCGGTRISDVRTTAKQVIDMEQMPKTTVVIPVCHECVCSDCDVVTAPKQPGIKGTSLGPNLLAFLISVWGKAVSAGNATALLNYTFWAGLCKTAIKHALVVASCKLQHTADGIHTSLSKSGHVTMDKTSIRIGGKRRYMWACIGNETVVIKVDILGAAEIDCHFPYYDKPITCDGYSVYNVFHTRQRYWTHVLQEAEFIKYFKRNHTTIILHRNL